MCAIIFSGKYLAVSKNMLIFASKSKYRYNMAKTKLRIKELLAERNMTQVDLANKLGVTKVTLNQNLTRNNWTLGKLEEIAAAIGCRVVDLFDNTYTITCPKCGEEINIVFNIKGFEGV